MRARTHSCGLGRAGARTHTGTPREHVFVFARTCVCARAHMSACVRAGGARTHNGDISLSLSHARKHTTRSCARRADAPAHTHTHTFTHGCVCARARTHACACDCMQRCVRAREGWAMHACVFGSQGPTVSIPNHLFLMHVQAQSWRGLRSGQPFLGRRSTVK